MAIKKEIKDDNEFYLWMNGRLIFKKWLDHGYSKVFDKGAWGKYTEKSITDFDLVDTPPLYIARCELYMLTSDEGGRETPFRSGYRPDHVFEYDENGKVEYAYMGDIHLSEEVTMQPGETRIVTIRFLSHQPIESHLTIGNTWNIHEGGIKVGRAKLLDVKLQEEN